MNLIRLVPAELRERELRRENSTCTEFWTALDAVKDPEIPALSIWDMGILQNVEQLSSSVKVTITPTYSGCPAMDLIKEDIEAAIRQMGVDQVEVITQLSPAWTTDWMTEDAQARMRESGIAAPDDTRVPGCRVHETEPEQLEIACPQCASRNTRMVSQFGSTACKALMQCNACSEPFDYFKRI